MAQDFVPTPTSHDSVRDARSAPFSPPHFAGRARFPHRKSYAALDLGTNNCRMLIARPDGEGFAVIDAFSRIVRLGEGMTASGRISDQAVERALSALSVCADKLARRNVTLARSVATEACRRAANGLEFVDRVYRETGIALDIISPEEEARLAVAGCYKMLEPGEGPGLIFDIGGGSTELVLIDTDGPLPRTIEWISLPWGVVSLAESDDQDAPDHHARAASYARMRARVAETLEGFGDAYRPGNGVLPRLLGTSGTVTTLASVHLKLESYDRSLVDGLVVPSESMREISRNLASQTIAQRAQWPCIGPERADLVIAGCAILDAILDQWPADTVGIADRGIREGILRELMASGEKATRRRT
jgi:exopolyphosphatase / guanosine-5'-triphosphate,3'-diphosphate pyrophosphatase